MKIEPITVTIHVDATPMKVLQDQLALQKMFQHCRAMKNRIEEMRSLRGQELLRAFDTFEKDTSHMLFKGGYLRGVKDAFLAAQQAEVIMPRRLCL